MTELGFIQDASLRKTIENAINFVYGLFDQSKKEEQSDLYKEETYRVIILYIISTIEPVLLYFYKQQPDRMERIEYKYKHVLPAEFTHIQKSASRIIIAIEEKGSKEDHAIGLFDLIMFFKARKLIIEKTAHSILELNEIRNTFHFSKSRKTSCDISKVEEAFQLLVHTLEHAPRKLQTK